MCRSVAIVRPIALPSSHTRIGRIVGITASGLGVALVGLTAFGLAHALIIVPIWTRLLGGVPFAVGAGLALALALMFVSAGPLPVAQSIRGAWLSLAIAPICLVAGAALATLRALLDTRSGAMGSPRSASALRQAQGAPSDPLRSESRGEGQGPPD